MTGILARKPLLLALPAAVAILLIVGLLGYRSRLNAGGAAAARFVGRESCARCHQEQFKSWKGSDHDLAMQVPSEQSIKGDFNNASFDYHGIVSTFSRKGDQYIVTTDGPDGKMTDYPVKYAFGHFPLQQYLIEFPGGRLQCLSVAWDSRAQKWYHLYPNEKIDYKDELHWTKRPQNWNYMCADCHSTNLKKNYDPAADQYHTSFSEINVSCEACHGPGSRHVQWANAGSALKWLWDSKGLVTQLKSDIQPGLPFDQYVAELKHVNPAPQISACAPCHSRRQLMGTDFIHGQKYADHYQLETLRDGLYFADGQFLDEVYEMGSFTQSKMYHHNVRCSDCHDPHSLKLRAAGNALCIRCHDPGKFNVPSHHHHQVASAGSQCVECHMPTRTYMGVDVRRDHSLRIPRPDLTVQLGVPNACAQCHADKPAQWAADSVVQWFGPKRPQTFGSEQHYAPILAAGRARKPEAEPDLARLSSDPQMPAIIRATALQLLRDYGGELSRQAFAKALNDPHELVRVAAVGSYELLPPDQRLKDLAPRLGDEVRSVRCEAARMLSALPRARLGSAQAAFDKALAEYLNAQLAVADQPPAHLNLAVLYANLGRFPEAEAEYKTAIRMDGAFYPAKLNLATFYNQQGRNPEAEQLLRQITERNPRVGEAWYSLGLLLAETAGNDPARTAQIAPTLAKAAQLMPTHPRVHYNAAIAFQRADQPDSAEKHYLRAWQLEPGSHDIGMGLAIFYLQQKQFSKAQYYAQEMVRLYPTHSDGPRLLRQIGDAMLRN